MATASSLKVKLQIYCGEEIAMGPGKADLLEAIDRTGSITGGARAIGMSYRRAWLLVDTLNRCWADPVVETVAGGGSEKGARLSLFGKRLLQIYRALQESVSTQAGGQFEGELAGLLRDAPRPSQHEPD